MSHDRTTPRSASEQEASVPTIRALGSRSSDVGDKANGQSSSSGGGAKAHLPPGPKLAPLNIPDVKRLSFATAAGQPIPEARDPENPPGGGKPSNGQNYFDRTSLNRLGSLSAASIGGVPLTPSSRMALQMAMMTPRRSERMHGDHEDPTSMYPMPRFPVSHKSATFEAMAEKKALILSPPEIYAECAHHGEEKTKYGWLKMVMLTIIAGCYVGFGFSLCLLIGGNIGLDIYRDRPGLFNLVFGAVGFPTGFTFIVICGGELFTSLCAYMAAAWWEGRATVMQCMRVWVVSWLGNFVGAALFVGLMNAAGSFDHKEAFTIILANKKVHHTFGSCFVLGIFCNWLVCIATWQANAAQDMFGKVIAIWLPISAFVMMGFEHIIANMYLLPLSISLGSGLSAYEVVVGNIIPTTLGNWVGGTFFVATVYAFAYGKPNKVLTDWADGQMSKWQGRKGASGGKAWGGKNGIDGQGSCKLPEGKDPADLLPA